MSRSDSVLASRIKQEMQILLSVQKHSIQSHQDYRILRYDIVHFVAHRLDKIILRSVKKQALTIMGDHGIVPMDIRLSILTKVVHEM
jgi:hypothetical protein